MLHYSKVLIGVIVAALGLPGLRSHAAAPESLNGYLREGRVSAGLTAYANPSNDEQRFALAMLQTLDGLQKFSAGMSKLGIRRDTARHLPFFRVAMPDVDQTKISTASPAEIAKLFTQFRAALRQANKTLTGVGTNDFVVEVNLSKVRLDLDGDGVCGPEETLLSSLSQVAGFGRGPQEGDDLVVRFDSADAAWLQGYTHFLSGFVDLLLAYDWSPVWNQCAHRLFYKPEPMPAIARFTSGARSPEWVDFIAAVHDMRLQLVEKDGVGRARDEFKSMIACSRVCWQRALAETDNNKEWLPSPKQTDLRSAKITQAEVDGWMQVLDEMEQIASGRKLLPHWRFNPGMGVNVDKLVQSPPQLDLVLADSGFRIDSLLRRGAGKRCSQVASAYATVWARFLQVCNME
jgi:hypothetical protein